MLRNKSNFTPRRGKDQDLDTYIDTLTKFPINKIPCKQNLSRREKEALRNLKQDDSIILKEADKGGAIVLMDKLYYRDKVLEQLNDDEYYKKTNSNIDDAVTRDIKKLMQKYSESFTEQEMDYVCNYEIKSSNCLRPTKNPQKPRNSDCN